MTEADKDARVMLTTGHVATLLLEFDAVRATALIDRYAGRPDMLRPEYADAMRVLINAASELRLSVSSPMPARPEGRRR